jgi:hypothetical protein
MAVFTGWRKQKKRELLPATLISTVGMEPVIYSRSSLDQAGPAPVHTSNPATWGSERSLRRSTAGLVPIPLLGRVSMHMQDRSAMPTRMKPPYDPATLNGRMGMERGLIGTLSIRHTSHNPKSPCSCCTRAWAGTNCSARLQPRVRGPPTPIWHLKRKHDSDVHSRGAWHVVSKRPPKGPLVTSQDSHDTTLFPFTRRCLAQTRCHGAPVAHQMTPGPWQTAAANTTATLSHLALSEGDVVRRQRCCLHSTGRVSATLSALAVV